jgi:hypothetical protein
LCCFGFSLVGSAAGGMLSGMGGQSGVDQEEVARRIEEAQPGWLAGTTTALYALGLLLSIVVIILLLLPPSSPFFRKAEPQWTPPAYPAP